MQVVLASGKGLAKSYAPQKSYESLGWVRGKEFEKYPGTPAVNRTATHGQPSAREHCERGCSAFAAVRSALFEPPFDALPSPFAQP